MHSARYVHWQEGDWWLGSLEEYPDYWTQGETLQELDEHLKDLYIDLSVGYIPGARRVGQLVMPRACRSDQGYRGERLRVGEAWRQA
jgi:predicted RNase H-like HicB family nuclease